MYIIYTCFWLSRFAFPIKMRCVRVCTVVVVVTFVWVVNYAFYGCDYNAVRYFKSEHFIYIFGWNADSLLLGKPHQLTHIYMLTYLSRSVWSIWSTYALQLISSILFFFCVFEMAFFFSLTFCCLLHTFRFSLFVFHFNNDKHNPKTVTKR